MTRRKIPCRTGESNLCQRRANLTLYQLSYIPGSRACYSCSLLTLWIIHNVLLVTDHHHLLLLLPTDALDHSQCAVGYWSSSLDPSSRALSEKKNHDFTVCFRWTDHEKNALVWSVSVIKKQSKNKNANKDHRDVKSLCSEDTIGEKDIKGSEILVEKQMRLRLLNWKKWVIWTSFLLRLP